MKPSFGTTSGNGIFAFTLLELLIVLSLIAILIALAVPQFEKILARSQSIACAANLRAIGVAVREFINDNDGTYPVIETNPEDPVYPEEIGALGMFETLEPYGVTEKMLRCPTDASGPNYFATRGTSYEWRPLIDGEVSINPVLFTRRGERTVNPARVRICTDIAPLHNGRMNALFGDGSVRRY